MHGALGRPPVPLGTVVLVPCRVQALRMMHDGRWGAGWLNGFWVSQLESIQRTLDV